MQGVSVLVVFTTTLSVDYIPLVLPFDYIIVRHVSDRVDSTLVYELLRSV
jgi:hypothetical protein